MGAVLGMAVGGGPIGMVAGGVGGFIVAKKLMGWATSSFANVATVLGAVGGGLLMAGMGFPMLAIGVIGGGLIARGIAALIKKLTGKSAILINRAIGDQEERSVDHRTPLASPGRRGATTDLDCYGHLRGKDIRADLRPVSRRLSRLHGSDPDRRCQGRPTGLHGVSEISDSL